MGRPALLRLLVKEGLVRKASSRALHFSFRFLGAEQPFEGAGPEDPANIFALISDGTRTIGMYESIEGSFHGIFEPSVPYLNLETFTFVRGATEASAELTWGNHFKSLRPIFEQQKVLEESSTGLADPTKWRLDGPLKSQASRFFVTPSGTYTYTPTDPVFYPNQGTLYFTPKNGKKTILERKAGSFSKAVKIAIRHHAGMA